MIAVEQLTFQYPGGARPAVRDLSFSVASGEVFGFLGPSGAGKSTAQRILNGLLRGFSGRAAVLGRELSAWGSDYYEKIGVSFELPRHYLKLSGRENLAYFAALYAGPTRRPEEVLALVGLGADMDVRVGSYSKGMKNRLSVARALLHRPVLLFLDEPTAGLDPVNARRIQKIIRAERAAGATVFLTTHDMQVAGALCDRVAFIVDGAIVAVGSPDELRLAHGRPAVAVTYFDDAGSVATAEFPLAALASNGQFQALLQSGRVRTLHTQEATLEDVFVALTGRALQ